LVSSRANPIQPPLRCKNASPDFSANFKLSLARLRILVKVLNGREQVAFGQRPGMANVACKSGFTLILRGRAFKAKTGIAAAGNRASLEMTHIALPRSS
jgi:hypothetical protein